MRKSDIFFLLAVASLPIQLNKFFFPEFSYVLGIPIDYRAIAIYFSDILIIGYLVLFFIEYRGKISKIVIPNKEFLTILTIFNIYLLLSSIFFSQSKEASTWFNIKIFLMSLTSFAAIISLEKPKIFQFFQRVLTISLVWQAVVIILQFFLQRSIGLWFLGERSFDTSTVNIAHIQILGVQFLRPYGTFPHPNVAAAFFVIGLLLIWKIKSKLYSVALTAALILTGSKAALFSLVLAVSLSKLKYLMLGFAVTLLGAWLFLKSITEFQIASIAERLILSQAALDIAVKNILFGVGSNNFILELSKLDLSSLAQIRLLQPVHNVFLLIIAENGLIGFLLFAALLFTVLKNASLPAGKAKSQLKIILFTIILIFASVDHFFWTLHQGQMLFFLSLSYILSKSDTIKHQQ